MAVPLALAPAGQTPIASFEGLGQMPGSPGQTYSNDISGDGRVVVGHAWLPDGAGGFDPVAFRWTATGGYENLGHLGGIESRAHATNLDGTVVVGQSRRADQLNRAFRWTGTTGNLSDANFRVRIINASSSSSRDFSLDWVAVRVHYQ